MPHLLDHGIVVVLSARFELATFGLEIRRPFQWNFESESESRLESSR